MPLIVNWAPHMTTLYIKFKINLEYSPGNIGIFDLSEIFGPQFHRWLPDGENDAIYLIRDDPDSSIKIWFDRCGFVDNDHIVFDESIGELSIDNIQKWGRIDGGPFFALLELFSVSNDLINILEMKSPEYETHYISFEKKIIKLFYPPVRRFFEILRSYYGQYWLPEIVEWDSRLETTNSYLNRHGFPHWSIDNGKTWKSLNSGILVGKVLRVRAQSDFLEFITEDDWVNIAKMVQRDHEPPIALSVLSKAIMLYDRGNIRSSLIYAVTALESAIDDSFINLLKSINFKSDLQAISLLERISILLSVGDLSDINTNEKHIERFSHYFKKNISKGKRLQILQSLLSIPDVNIESCKTIINLRNDIVHKYKELPDDISENFNHFLHTFRYLYPCNSLKFPFPNPGNKLYCNDKDEFR